MFEQNNSGSNSFSDADVSNWLEEGSARSTADASVAVADEDTASDAGASVGFAASPLSAAVRHLTRDNARELARELNELPASELPAIVVDDASGLSVEFLRRLQAVDPQVRVPDEALVRVAVAPSPLARFAPLVAASLTLVIASAVWGIGLGWTFGGYVI